MTDNITTKKMLNRLRGRFEQFRYMNIEDFIELLLSCTDYKITNYQHEATQAFIINSRNQFTFCNNNPFEEENTITRRGIRKLYTEYYNKLTPLLKETRKITYTKF